MRGSWTRATDATSPNNTKMATPDKVSLPTPNGPLAHPDDYVDIPFSATANIPYTIWMRMKPAAIRSSTIHCGLQFSNAQAERLGDLSGCSRRRRCSSTSRPTAARASVQNWGWQNDAYWLTQPTRITFPSGGGDDASSAGEEDGVEWDQIVLSPRRYLSSAPGPVSNDSTIVPRP